jgi:hypothetical protein
MKQHKLNCSKEAWGIFSFFSSTNVETKNVCPIAYNVWQPYAVGAFNHCTNLEAQNYE